MDDKSKNEIEFTINKSLIKNEVKINGAFTNVNDLENLFEKIKKTVCHIKYGKFSGTGFFCQLPDPENENKILRVLISCYHVIPINDYYQCNKNKIINDNFSNNNDLGSINDTYIEDNIEDILINNDNVNFNDNKNDKIKEKNNSFDKEEKILDLNNRRIWMNIESNLDYICIEILKEDNIQEFLNINIDFININNNDNDFRDNQIYIFGYYENELKYDKGSIKKINNNYLCHNCNTTCGFSGGPIFNKTNNLIGIHKGGYNDKGKEISLNIGIFLKYIYNNMKEKKHINLNHIIINNNNMNEISHGLNRIIINYNNMKGSHSIALNPNSINNNNINTKIKWIFIIIFFILLVLLFILVNMLIKVEENKEEDNDEYIIKHFNQLTKEYSFSHQINEPGSYQFCLYGAKAIKGGKGGKICGIHKFFTKQTIYIKLGSRNSGGLGGEGCGYLLKGKGYNGAGLSLVQLSDDYLIVAGGGGGDSENGNNGGNAGCNGSGDYGGKGATPNGPGKGGEGKLTLSEDGKKFEGGNGIARQFFGDYCGGGGGDGYYGGGSGGAGPKSWAGGGGGGSNYCNTNEKCDNFYYINLNDISDYAGITVKKIRIE